jgi:hypothetical protein
MPVLLYSAGFGQVSILLSFNFILPSISLVRPLRRLSSVPTGVFRRQRAQVVSRLGRLSRPTEGLTLTRPSTLARCHESELRYPLVIQLKGVGVAHRPALLSGIGTQWPSHDGVRKMKWNYLRRVLIVN